MINEYEEQFLDYSLKNNFIDKLERDNVDKIIYIKNTDGILKQRAENEIDNLISQDIFKIIKTIPLKGRVFYLLQPSYKFN